MGKARANKRHVVHLDVVVNGQSLLLEGRIAWMMDELIRRGDRGMTAAEAPGARLAHYVHILRRYGVVIQTNVEKHAGAFSGTHARYVLHSPVKVVRAA